MVDGLKLLRDSSLGIDYIINDNIKISHPTLGEICEFGESKYYSMAMSLCCNPSAYKVALHDMGIDWTTLSDFEFFIMMSQNLTQDMTAPLLGDLDLSKLILGRSNETDEILLCAETDGVLSVMIDRALYMQTSSYIRKMHGFEYKAEKPADEYTRKYLIEREKKRLKRRAKEPFESMLEPLVSSMVNQPGFKYDYSSVWDLSISAFNNSVVRTQKFLHYTQTMGGIYAGTISMKDINKDDLNWMN